MNGYELIEADIEIIDHQGKVIIEVDGQQASRKVQIMRTNDRLKAILGDANARVNVSLSESIGGPYGYSNVKISVSVTLACDQNAESVTKAQQFCLDSCSEFLESNVGFAHKQLTDHLARYYVKEG